MLETIETQCVEATSTDEECVEVAAIDWAHLARFTMGDAALENEVLELFRAHTIVQIQQLRDAVGNAGAWHAATHGIKGSARGIGAWPLAAAAEAAERDIAASRDVHEWHIAQLVDVIASTNAATLDRAG